MDEDSKSLTLQFLPEPSTLDPEKIVRRMGEPDSGHADGHGGGARDGDPKMMPLIAERDDEVDRLYFLLVRAIRTATIDHEVARRYGLSPVECLDFRVLASFLEGLATRSPSSRRGRRQSLPQERYPASLAMSSGTGGDGGDRYQGLPRAQVRRRQERLPRGRLDAAESRRRPQKDFAEQDHVHPSGRRPP